MSFCRNNRLGDPENLQNRLTNLREGGINIINVSGSDGNITNAYEEQLFQGRRILIELPLYAAAAGEHPLDDDTDTIDEDNSEDLM